MAASATIPNIYDVGQWMGQGWSEGGMTLDNRYDTYPKFRLLH